MTRSFLILSNPAIREKAINMIHAAADYSRIEFKTPKRSLDQNSKMWAMLSDISEQVIWYGVKYDSEDWKLILLNGLNKEMRIAPDIDGTGVVPLGRSSSKLSKSEMRDLIELIYAFGSQQNVNWSEPILTERTA